MRERSLSGRRRVGFLISLALSLVAASLSFVPAVAGAAVGGPAIGSTFAQIGGACIDELEGITPDETAAVFGVVTIPPGATFSANIRHEIETSNSNGWNAEVRLAPLRSDGFPEEDVRYVGYAADGPWTDSVQQSGSFAYTNPSTSTRTDFVFEIGYWNRPFGQLGKTIASNFLVTPVGDPGGPACVEAHTPPELPTGNSCNAWPTLIASGGSVYSEPFSMDRDNRLAFKMLDTFPRREYSDGTKWPVVRNDWIARAQLWGRNSGDTSWTFIDRDDHVTENNWVRDAYLGSFDIYLDNDSAFTEVRVQLFPRFAPDNAATSSVFASSMFDGAWSSFCPGPEEDTATLSTPECGTGSIVATITNNSDTGRRYAVRAVRANRTVARGAGTFIAAGATKEFTLNNVPNGTYLMRVMQARDEVASQPDVVFESCAPTGGPDCPTDSSFVFVSATTDVSFIIDGWLPYWNAKKVRANTAGADGRVYVMVDGVIHPDSDHEPGGSGVVDLVVRDRDALRRWSGTAEVQLAVAENGDTANAVPCGQAQVVGLPMDSSTQTIQPEPLAFVCGILEFKGGPDDTVCEAYASNELTEHLYWQAQLPRAEFQAIDLDCDVYVDPPLINAPLADQIAGLCAEILTYPDVYFEALNLIGPSIGSGNCYLRQIGVVLDGISVARHSGSDSTSNPLCDASYTQQWNDLDSYIRNFFCVTYPNFVFQQYQIDGSNTCPGTSGPAADPVKLRRNLIAAGVSAPPETAAHHIVAGDHPNAQNDEARAKLASFNININSALNGVFLPRFCSSANPNGHASHSKIHTTEYFTDVNLRLRATSSRAQAIEVLEDVRNILRTEAAWDYYLSPCTPTLGDPALTLVGNRVIADWSDAQAADRYDIWWYQDDTRFSIRKPTVSEDDFDIGNRTGLICFRVRSRNPALYGTKVSAFSTPKSTMPCVQVD